MGGPLILCHTDSLAATGGQMAGLEPYSPPGTGALPNTGDPSADAALGALAEAMARHCDMASVTHGRVAGAMFEHVTAFRSADG